MNVVWQHIIAAVLAITNFSIKANPKAPDGNAVLAYAVDDADFVVHLDWKSTIADNYAVFIKLPDDPLVKQAPELHEALTEITMQAEGVRSMGKSMFGFDPIDGYSSMTAFAKLTAPGKAPELLIVLRGTFTADGMLKAFKQMGGKETTLTNGHPAVSTPDGMMASMAKDGSILVGARDWVTARVGDDWKTPARAKNSAWARIATALDAKPFFLIASKPSADAVAMMTKDLGQSFGKDLLAGHDFAVFTAASTGIGWMFQAKDAAMAQRIKVASEGLIDLLRASHLAPRGVAQLMAAALPSYARMSPEIDAILASKDKLMTAMWDMTGDGKFEAKVKLEGNLVTVTTKAKKISDVVPASMVMAFGAIGYMVERSGKSEQSVMPTPTRTPKPATGKVTPPPGKSGLGTPVHHPAQLPN